MKNQTLHRKPTNVIALAGVFTLIGAFSANAAFVTLNPGTPLGGLALPGVTAGDGTLTGTVLAVRDANFSDIGTPPPLNTGTLRSFVVDRGAGLLDFYYQVVSNSSPAEELERIRSIGGFDPSLNLQVDQVTGASLAGLLPGTSGFAAGSYNTSLVGLQGAATADRDQGSVGSVGFDFSGAIISPNNLQGGEHSSFLVIRTNSTQFGNVAAELTGTGGTSFASTFAAVPEPSSVIFGLGVLGVCLRGRRSRRA